MKRREWVLAGMGIVLLVAGWLWNRANQIAPYTIPVVIEANGCRIPADMMYDLEGPLEAQPVAIIFHGLAANRKIMWPLAHAFAGSGWRVLLVDLPGHGDNTEPFSFARAEVCAAAAVNYVMEKEKVPQERIILVGHSMGGAIAIRLAKQFPNTAATIALSPAPEVLPKWAPQAFLPYPPAEKIPGNLLIIMAELDLPFSGKSAEGIVARAGGPRNSPKDFAERRAVKVVSVTNTAHTSVMFADQTWEEMDQWLRGVLGGTPPRLWTPVLKALWPGLAGLFLMCPFAASVFVRIFVRVNATNLQESEPDSTNLMWWRWLAAGGAASVMLWAARSFIPARIYERDYFPISLFLTAVLVFTQATWRARGRAQQAAPLQMKLVNGEWRKIAAGILFAIVVMLAFGWWLDLNIYDAWLNGPRWIRFAALVPVLLPFSIAEERGLGRIEDTKNVSGRWPAKARRYAGYLMRRFMLWMVLLAGIFVFSSGQILLMLAAAYMLSFTVCQRIAVDAVWGRTDSLAAAAAANAILSAWFLSLFPMT